ncbi:hypothetical protein Tco_1292290 [Tanacetum coccineum]
MASSITRFDIEKFDEKNDFGLWQIKMCALMVQQGCDAALETLPADIEAGEKATLIKKAYSTKLGDHIDEFKKLILDLVNINIGIEDEDQELMMLKKRTKGIKEETSDGLYSRGRSDHSGKALSSGSSQFKSRGGTSKLKCFRRHSKGHLKRGCPMKKSSGFVKKGKRDQDSDSSDDEGNAYFRESLVVVGNDETTELIMDSGDNRTCTIKGTGKVKIQLHDGLSFILEDVRYVPRLRRSLISLGTLEKDGYTVKMKMSRIKVIIGCRVMMTGIRKRKCVYTLEAKVMTFGVQKHGGSKQVGLKQLSSKQIGFKQLGHKQVGFKQLDHGVETGVHGVHDENVFGLRWNCRELNRIVKLRFFMLVTMMLQWLKDGLRTSNLKKRQTLIAW